jgi:branched-chain amino acid transport system substrate-binding protein
VGALVLMLTAAACADEANGGGAGGSDDAILIGAVYPETGTTSVPDWGEGVKAAEAYINDTLGGVDGSPVKVIYCDDQNQDPSKNAACTRNFVQQKVTAIMNYGGAFGTGGLPVAESAKIAAFTPASSLAEQQSDVTLIPHADQTGGYAAIFGYAAQNGVDTVGSLIINIPDVVAGLTASIKLAADKAGIQVVNTVPEAGDAADFTPALLKASDGADLVTMSFGTASMTQIMKAAESNGIDVQFAASQTAVNIPALVEPAGAAAEGLLAYSGVLAFTDEQDPDVKVYRDAMTKAGYADSIGAVSEAGFSYLMTAYNALKEMPDSDAATFLKYMQSNPIPVFLGQTYDATNVPFPDRPAVHVTATRVLQVKDGTFVDVGGDWIDEYAK